MRRVYWYKGFMNFNKFISIITTACFLVSFIASPAVQAMQAPVPGQLDFNKAAEGLNLPGTVGRVTGGKIFGDGLLVINIQDLHCHAEVQKNISRILEMIEAQYGLKNVLVEGAAGDVDTSWLTSLKDNALKKKIAETLLNQGRLTGAEYYSVLNNKPRLLKGLEDEKLHTENIARLGKILERRPVYDQKIKKLTEDLNFLEAKYFSSRNRKFNKALESYKEGGMTPEKYYTLLVKYAEKINNGSNPFNPVLAIRVKDYPNIAGYLNMIEAGKRIRYNRVGYQLQGFVQQLKAKLPYNEYTKLIEKTNNFAKLDQAYLSLAQISEQYHMHLEGEYPDLAAFFEYLEKGRKVNPMALIDEERRLTEAVRIGLARNVAELEVSFAADFFVCFKDYLLNRLSADDYEYFTQRFDKFKTIWGKYVYANRLNDMLPISPFLMSSTALTTNAAAAFYRAWQIALSALQQGKKTPAARMLQLPSPG